MRRLRRTSDAFPYGPRKSDGARKAAGELAGDRDRRPAAGGSPGGTGGDGTPQWQAPVIDELAKWLLGDILGKLTGKTESQQDEQHVAQDFDPSKIHEATDLDGHKAWVMDDGKMFVDGNDNGVPDAEFQLDPSGSGDLWVNGGEGWVDVGKH